MIVYVPVGNGPLRREIVAAGHGMIVQSNRFRFPKLDCPWVMDNGAFEAYKNGTPWDMDQFDAVVERLTKVQPCKRPAWALTPDMVAHPASLAWSVGYRKKRLPDCLNWYLAIQDGMEFAHVENALATARFDGLFIGGSTDWKNQRAAEWCMWGKAHKLPVHIGRVNGWKRLQWAVNIGADSVDGTGWTRDPRWIEYLKDLPKVERMLWDVPQNAEGNSRTGERPAATA